MRALKLDDPSMLAAARGRLTSWKWRAGQGLVFAAGAALVLGDATIGFGWFALLCASMVADFFAGRRYVGAKTSRERTVNGGVFIAACALTITVFAAMAIWLAVAGGDQGRLLGALMAASSLVSVMLFSFHAPVFMMITAVPCTLCLAAIPFAPTLQNTTNPVLAALGAALGVVGFLAYVARSALTSGKLFEGLEKANAAAKERQIIAESRQAEAEEASRVKSEFLTTMTHELRTPLNAVIGYSEIIGEDMEAEGFKDLAQDAARITAAARHLLGLIDQILQLTQIDAGRTNVELDELDVRKLIDSVVAAQTEAAKANNNRIATRIAPDVTTAHTDSEKLGVCLAQLVSNAVKFTKNGLVAISAEREAADGRDWLRIAVSDTGSGMTPDEIAKAFQPFTQLDGSATRTQGGMGIGLSITARTAEALGGDVTAVSEPGAGSTFTLRVPMRFARGEGEHVENVDIGAAA